MGENKVKKLYKGKKKKRVVEKADVWRSFETAEWVANEQFECVCVAIQGRMMEGAEKLIHGSD